MLQCSYTSKRYFCYMIFFCKIGEHCAVLSEANICHWNKTRRLKVQFHASSVRVVHLSSKLSIILILKVIFFHQYKRVYWHIYFFTIYKVIFLQNAENDRFFPSSRAIPICITVHTFRSHSINTLRPKQNGRHFADDIFKCILLNENVWITINKFTEVCS